MIHSRRSLFALVLWLPHVANAMCCLFLSLLFQGLFLGDPAQSRDGGIVSNTLLHGPTLALLP